MNTGVVMNQGCRARFILFKCQLRTERNVLQTIFTNKISEFAYLSNYVNVYSIVAVILSPLSPLFSAFTSTDHTTSKLDYLPIVFDCGKKSLY